MWYAKWKYGSEKYLNAGDAGIGDMSWVGDTPQYFKTKRELQNYTRQWYRGTWIICKK